MFYGCSGLTNVTIPDSVTSIGDWAFYGCSSLTSVSIPDCVTNIGGGAFAGCSGLTSITIPNSVTSIGSYAFSGCSSLRGVTIQQYVCTNRLYNVFDGYVGSVYPCTNLMEVIVSDGVKVLGENLCRGCTSLEKVVIPDSVTEVATNAFVTCSNLVDVTMPWMPDMKMAKIFPDSYKKIKTITLTGSIDHIPSEAFKGCASLERVEIPKEVKRVGASAFDGCVSLTGLELPDGVGDVGASAFKGCKALKNPIELPNSVTNIGASAFADCTGMEAVDWHWWPWRINEISSSLFKGCTGLERVDGISSNIGRIGASAFEGCENLSSILLPSSVTNMGAKVFQGCSRLASAQLPSNLKAIPDYTFNGCGKLTSVTMPSAPKSIGKAAFFGCNRMTYIPIPATVKSIGDAAFGWCDWLRSLDIPEGVVSVSKEMCENCIGLSRITLPLGVTNICDRALYGCTNLTSITLPGTVTSLGTNAFARCANLRTILLDDRTEGISFVSNTIPAATAVRVMERVGYSFAGWIDEKGTSLIDPFHMNANITTFPKWTMTGGGGSHNGGGEGEFINDEVDGSVPTAAASVYDGMIVDGNGGVRGSIQIKVGKAKAGVAAVKATAVIGGKKITLKADGGGKVAINDGAPTVVTLVGGGETYSVTLGADGLSGGSDAYTIDGSRNLFASKDKGEQGEANGTLDKWLGAVNAAWSGGTVSVAIAKKGRAKATVILADGTKAMATAQLIVGDEWCCVPVVVTKKANVSFALWLSSDGKTAKVDGLGDAVVGKAGALPVGASFHVASDAALWSQVAGTALTEYLPDGVSVERRGAKWFCPKAGKVKYLRGSMDVDDAKLGDNPAALKLSYKAKDGSFSGSFKVYSDNGGKLKVTKVTVAGVMVGNVGYGSTSIKRVGSVWIEID